MWDEQYDECAQDDNQWWQHQDSEREQYEDDCRERAEDMREEFRKMG